MSPVTAAYRVFNMDLATRARTPSRLSPRMMKIGTFLAGLLFSFGFAPFHLPGLSLLSLALFYVQLSGVSKKQAFQHGLLFGLGAFGFGISWVYVSIHDYGHLHPVVSACITFVFVLYLSCFTACFAWLDRLYAMQLTHALLRTALFSLLWVLSEYARATLFTGFPWLLLGIGQIDTPLRSLLPIVGVYGTGFIACLAATWLGQAMMSLQSKRLHWAVSGILLVLLPGLFQHHVWTNEQNDPISVGVVQANLAMRDKWNQALFWSILAHYETQTLSLLGTNLIVLPESAIPLTEHYVHDYLTALNHQAKKKHSALLLGIPKAFSETPETEYYNSLLGLGEASGHYLKRHLVPFGEFIPSHFKTLTDTIDLPDPGIVSGSAHQPLIQVNHHPIASLICYEIAYASLLRNQLPLAQWIVSISDDGWFGHSFAIYQQQQIAQVRSLQTGRYQIMSNNDGLSSLINAQGEIIAALPAFSAGILRGVIKPATGLTPWSHIGDQSIIAVLLTLFLCYPLAQLLKKTVSLSIHFN